jgi:hypothetical protein
MRDWGTRRLAEKILPSTEKLEEWKIVFIL